MKRIMSIMCIVLIGILLCVGNSFAKDPKDMQIVYIVKDLVNPFFVEMKWGGFAAAKEHGVQYTCLAPERYSVENQIRIMEDAIQKKVDAIVIVPIDGKGIVSAIERANKAGIPVFNCNTRAAGGEVIGFAGIDHVALGRAVGEFTVKKLNGKGQIVILEGTTGASSAQERLQGMHEVLDKYAEIKILASTTAKYNRQMGMKVTEDLLVRFPKIDAILAANDSMALGAKEAANDAKRLKDMFIIGIDANPEALSAVEAGELTATINGGAFDQGFVATDLTCRYLISQQAPPADTKVRTGKGEAVTKENIVEYRKFKNDLFEKYGLKPMY
jgi:ribose transport system substrate-binding protein